MKITRNPDDGAYQVATLAVEENGGYCPCKLVKDDDTWCMCKEFREQAEGMCECGRYVKIREEGDN